MKKQGSGVSGQGPEKLQNPPTITAQTVRAALRELGQSHWSGVAEFFKVQTFLEREKVKQVLEDLEKGGQAKCTGPGIYMLTDKPGAGGGVQAKLWEFACLRFATAKPFAAAEAARLAECDRDYTKRYYRWLWNSGYLAIVSRGRAGALLYQVVGGKEHEPAPAWNRRAEKRKGSGQGSVVRGQEEVGQAPPPAAPAAAGIITRDPAISFFDEEIKEQKPSPRERLDAALEDFGRALVDITGSIGRAWEIIREMKGELLAIEEQNHDEPGEPTESHH